jgi:hypothetical protein
MLDDCRDHFPGPWRICAVTELTRLAVCTATAKNLVVFVYEGGPLPPTEHCGSNWMEIIFGYLVATCREDITAGLTLLQEGDGSIHTTTAT